MTDTPDRATPVDTAVEHVLKVADQFRLGLLMPEELLDECRDVLNMIAASREDEDEYEVSCVRIETAASPEQAVEQTHNTPWSWQVLNLRTQQLTEVEHS